MAEKQAGAFKGREDHRRARELEEARKAGTIPAEKDEDGNEINPHIPQFMSQAPWYLNQDAPGLKHTKLREKQPVAIATDFVPRGRSLGDAATSFRKGACTNCGAMTHKAVDCVERPRKKGAKYTGKDIKADEFVADVVFDYAGKRCAAPCGGCGGCGGCIVRRSEATENPSFRLGRSWPLSTHAEALSPDPPTPALLLYPPRPLRPAVTTGPTTMRATTWAS